MYLAAATACTKIIGQKNETCKQLNLNRGRPMKERKINLKLELTEGYQKRFTESYCRRVLAKRNQQLTPPTVTTERKEKQYESIKR